MNETERTAGRDRPGATPAAEAALAGTTAESKRREPRLAAVIAAAMDAIIAINERNEIILINPAAERMFGYGEAQLLGKPVSVLMPERYREAHEAHVLNFARTNDANRAMGRFGEIVGLCSDGREIRIDASIAQSELAGERLFTVTLRDITQRLELEKALRSNYELLDRIFATTHFCVVCLDRDLNFVRVNKAYADACGHPPEFFVGKNHFELYPGEEVEAIFRNVVATGEPYSIYANPFEFPDHPEWGVSYWDWTLHPLKSAGGAVDGLLFALLDVSARTRAAQELERKTALTQLLESLARAANEAATPAEAMKVCLLCLCDHDDWALGRVATTDQWGDEPDIADDSVWHAADLVRHADFIQASRSIRSLGVSGQFVFLVLRDKKPVWLPDIAAAHGFMRREAALAAGLRAAFAFPVLVQGEVVAFIELYADAPRAVDAALVEASEIIAAQIARLIERSRAMSRQRQLAVIVENSSDAILSCGPDRRILTWNAAAERLFAYSAAEAIGRDGLMLVPSEERGITGLRFALLTDGARVPPYEGVRIAKDGRRIDVAASASPLLDANGRLQGVALIFRDISEQRRAERDRGRLAAIVESSNDAILLRGLDRSILSWNAAAERLFGWTAAEAVGQPIDLIIPSEHIATRHRRSEGAGRSKFVRPVEAIHVCKDGTRIPTQVTVSPVSDEHGKIFAHSYTVRDMSEIREKEETLRRYAGRLRHLSQRLREVEESERRAISRELHDRIGQDLSTLGLMMGRLDAELSQESRRAVETHLRAMSGLLKFMAANVRDVMAELRPPALDDYGLFAALRQLAAEFETRCGIAVELRGADLQPRLPPIVETAMYRICHEALNNVVKHARAKRVQIGLHAAAERVVLEIADDGIGFDASQAPPDQRHWGLATMRERAEGVGIEFGLESVAGSGTRIVLAAERAAP